LAGIRKRTLIMAMTLLASLAALAVASPALANFAQFAQCPTGTPGVEDCTFAQTTSGEFSIGSTKVPITSTITLQGGLIPAGEGNFYLYPPKNGESISKTELNVPGGLLDLINCKEIKGEGFFEKIERGTCEAIFENKTTGVTATTEIVANAGNPAILNPGNIINQTGTALTLPVRVHLKNPLLGSGCYVGSEASPIELHLTTGTTSPPAPNKPIKGKAGSFGTEEEGDILVISENSLVDNAFSAPVAEGCGEFFSFLIDPLVDAKLGLPSAAGHNSAILSGTLKVAGATVVVEHGY
jgi:hypothetical protein